MADPATNKIRGNVLLARLSFVRGKGGESQLELVLNKLSAEDQNVLRGHLWDAGLYPFDVNKRFDQAIAETLSPANPNKTYLEIGRASAELNLRAAHKIFITEGNPQRFLGMAPQIYSFYYSEGYRTYEKLGPTSGLLRTFEAKNVTPSDCLTVIGWHQRALEICGAAQVQINETRCRARGHTCCEYHFDWE